MTHTISSSDLILLIQGSTWNPCYEISCIFYTST